MDADKARELLAAERDRIEKALSALGRSDDGEEAVERAEARLAAGTYGLSVKSGEPIPDERLEFVPTAELTADEERALPEA
jgi:DnaK suppressor protein